MDGLGYSPFARHYLGNHYLFSFPAGTKMFQFPALASYIVGWRVFNTPGCPIRKSLDQRSFAPPQSLSQLITSFIASESQGIRHAPFFTFFIFKHRIRLATYPVFGWYILLAFYLLLKLLFACTICHRSYLRNYKLKIINYNSKVVENNGFEPLTLCVQGRCSSQLS